MATYWLLGDLDNHPKEFYWCDRDPVSGNIPHDYPWRMTTALLRDGQTTHRCFCQAYLGMCDTFLLNHMRLRMLLEALIHALVCWSLYRLLRLLRLSVAASAAASLLFLSSPVAVYPAGIGEAMIPTYLFFMMTCIYLGSFHVRHELVAMVVLAGAATCFYEIAGPVYIALPLLYAAMHADYALPPQRRRMLVPIACMLAVFVLYACMTILTREPVRRGGVDSFTPLGSLGAKVATVARHVAGQFCFNGLLGDALREGWQRLGPHWLVWGAVYAVAAWLFLWWWNSAAALEPDDDEDGPRRRPGLVMLFGFLMALLPWSLVVMIHLPSWNTRACYYPLAGAVIAGAAAMDLAGTWLRHNRSWSRLYWKAAGVLVLGGSLCGAVAMLGIQSWYQVRGQQNKEFVCGLRELAPNPPPAAFFMPISLCPPQPDEVSRARLNHMDKYNPPLWGDSVAATVALDFAYHRRDIGCWQISGKTMEDLERWAEQDVDNGEVFQMANTRGFSIPVLHTNHQDHELHSWHNVLPFTIDCAHHLQLIGAVHLEHADNRDEDIKLPWVTTAASRPHLVGEVALSAPQPGHDPGTYLQWRWVNGGQPVPWQYVQDGAIRRNMAFLSASLSAVYAVLLPCKQPLHIYCRVRSKQPQAALDVLVNAGMEPAAGSLFTHYSVEGSEKWKPVTVEVQPHSTAQCLVLRGTEGCVLTQPLNDLPSSSGRLGVQSGQSAQPRDGAMVVEGIKRNLSRQAQ